MLLTLAACTSSNSGSAMEASIRDASVANNVDSGFSVRPNAMDAAILDARSMASDGKAQAFRSRE
jgi:hypothetical protein